MTRNDSKYFFQAFKKCACNTVDMDLLFDYCRRIAKNYLYKRNLNYNFLNSGSLTLDDLSIESIASLFLNNSQVGKIEILKSFENLRIEIESESQFNYILHKIIWNRTEQHITKILKDQDPILARILKNIEYFITKHKLRKQSYFGRTFIVKNDTGKIDSKVIDENTFNGLSIGLISIRTKPDIDRLFSVIQNEYEFFPAIPLVALAKRLKLSFSNEYRNSIPDSSYNEGYNSLMVEELVDQGLNKSISHLNSFYVAHHKLNCSDSELFIKGLKDIAEDVKDGGINRGLYEYLFRHKTNLSKEEFNSKYYQQFEYLVRIFKNTIADEILGTEKE